MTALNPSTLTIHPPPDDDPLGAAIVAAFSRDLGYRLTWDWPVVLTLGLLTAGLVPLIVLTLRFRRFATSEKFQLEHVTEWIEKRDSAMPELSAATAHLRDFWPFLSASGIVLASLALVVAVAHVWITDLSPPDLASLYS